MPCFDKDLPFDLGNCPTWGDTTVGKISENFANLLEGLKEVAGCAETWAAGNSDTLVKGQDCRFYLLNKGANANADPEGAGAANWQGFDCLTDLIAYVFAQIPSVSLDCTTRVLTVNDCTLMIPDPSPSGNLVPGTVVGSGSGCITMPEPGVYFAAWAQGSSVVVRRPTSAKQAIGAGGDPSGSGCPTTSSGFPSQVGGTNSACCENISYLVPDQNIGAYGCDRGSVTTVCSQVRRDGGLTSLTYLGTLAEFGIPV